MPDGVRAHELLLDRDVKEVGILSSTGIILLALLLLSLVLLDLPVLLE